VRAVGAYFELLQREHNVKISNGIDSTGNLERPGAEPAPAARAKTVQGAAQGNSASGTIRISDLSSQLAQLESRFAADGAFDAARVDQIKAAMRAGRFTVNPDLVADRLLDSVRELLRKPV
jgi:negative regulator of flagellin synthesis FlgM